MFYNVLVRTFLSFPKNVSFKHVCFVDSEYKFDVLKLSQSMD